MVRGSTNAYKGSYKERIEGALNLVAERAKPGSTVFLDIEGEESNSVERLCDPALLIKAGRIAEDAAIIQTARRYGVPDILIRGRHLIAPSPAIAHFLEAWNGRDSCKRILDMFGGTGLATKVACTYSQAQEIVYVDIDSDKVERARKHIHDSRASFVHADAFDLAVENVYDLVVADPYYEDVLRFVDEKALQIRDFARCLLLAPGNVEDSHWNASVCSRLMEFGFLVREHAAFGQVLLECTPCTRA